MECEPGGGPCGGTSVGSGTAVGKAFSNILEGI
jgi:hypothetical protein